MVCSEDVFQPCLGVLEVPLNTVPDSSPRALKGVAPEASEEWFDSSEVLILLRCLGRPCCSHMRPGRSPGARSGSEFSCWFVVVFNGSAVAWCESSPRASARSKRTIKDHLDFYCTPLRRLSARRKGGSAMLPSEGIEHGVSSELLAGEPSGRPSPIR
jgi:hypothetical protein